MTRYWPVRDSLRGPPSPPHPSGPTEESCSASDDGRRENVLRCSGTPRISGKLFTGLSVGRTAALCIIVIQTGNQAHTHTPAAPWAHRSPSVPCRGEKQKECWSRGPPLQLRRLWLSAPVSIPEDVDRAVPCRAVFWSESDRLPCPFSAAGVAGPDVTAAETEWGPMGAEEEEPPPPRFLHRCTREEEEEEERSRKCLRGGGTSFPGSP